MLKGLVHQKMKFLSLVIPNPLHYHSFSEHKWWNLRNFCPSIENYHFDASKSP